jgi:hypothetical protein
MSRFTKSECQTGAPMTRFPEELYKLMLKQLEEARAAFYADRREAGRRYGGGLSSSTMGNLHRLLSLILKSAVKAKKLAASPIGDVQTKPRPKTKTISVLDENELALLLGHLSNGPLYLPALMSAYTGDAFSKTFTAEAAAIKPIRFHDLRHTHITHLLRNGVPVHVVSAGAGHSSPTITLNTYAHLLGGDDDRAGGF